MPSYSWPTELAYKVGQTATIKVNAKYVDNTPIPYSDFSKLGIFVTSSSTSMNGITIDVSKLHVDGTIKVKYNQQLTATNLKTYGMMGRITPNGYRSYVKDGHGDVVKMLNAQGTQVASYQYEGYGLLTSKTGTEANPFRYSGEYFDEETGFIYLRARYYNPEIMRFITEDTYVGVLTNPLSQNRYSYCEGNPVNFADPTGQWLDTVFDVIGLIDSLANAISNPTVATIGMVAIDAVCILVPLATSPSGVKVASKVAAEATEKVIKTVDNKIVDVAKAVDNKVTKNVVEGGVKPKTNYYVTPKGGSIPSSRAEFNDNLSKMTNDSGKYLGDSSSGPVRVRVESAHPEDPGFTGIENPDHIIPHVHVEYRKNGLTGPWGKGDPSNKTTIPQDWLN